MLYLPSPVTVILAWASIFPNTLWASQTYTASSSTHRPKKRDIQVWTTCLFIHDLSTPTINWLSLLMWRPPALWMTLPWVRGLLNRASPSSLLQTTCGSGWPWTWHARVTLEPMSAAASDGCRVNLGAAIRFRVRDGTGSEHGTNPSSWFKFHRQLSCLLCELQQFLRRF